MNYKFTIKGTLPGLNELIEAERRNRQCGAKLKKQCEAVVMNAARQMGGAEIQLKKTGEITVESNRHYTVITV